VCGIRSNPALWCTALIFYYLYMVSPINRFFFLSLIGFFCRLLRDWHGVLQRTQQMIKRFFTVNNLNVFEASSHTYCHAASEAVTVDRDLTTRGEEGGAEKNPFKCTVQCIKIKKGLVMGYRAGRKKTRLIRVALYYTITHYAYTHYAKIYYDLALVFFYQHQQKNIPLPDCTSLPRNQ